jgi:hypothetical protein
VPHHALRIPQAAAVELEIAAERMLIIARSG